MALAKHSEHQYSPGCALCPAPWMMTNIIPEDHQTEAQEGNGMSDKNPIYLCSGYKPNYMEYLCIYLYLWYFMFGIILVCT